MTSTHLKYTLNVSIGQYSNDRPSDPPWSSGLQERWSYFTPSTFVVWFSHLNHLNFSSVAVIQRCSRFEKAEIKTNLNKINIHQIIERVSLDRRQFKSFWFADVRCCWWCSFGNYQMNPKRILLDASMIVIIIQPSVHRVALLRLTRGLLMVIQILVIICRCPPPDDLVVRSKIAD